MILGIDEVGRGPWAGPLVVGAVVLGDLEIEGLTDSKKLTAKRREVLDGEIRKKALGFGLGWVYSDELDNIGLSDGLKLATKRAVEQVKVPYHEIIIDGTTNFLNNTAKGDYVTLMKKADLLVPSVSAASIIAKVARDSYMHEQEVKYPGYGFASHVGYGTAKHRQAIEQYGLTPLHRRSFAPIANYIESKNVTSKDIGNVGELIAQSFLESNGYRVVASQWRTRWCEIDIVAENNNEILFVEVKTRNSSKFGSALDAITDKKRRQMHLAANMYLVNNKTNKNVQLAVVAIDGRVGRMLKIE